MCVVVLFFGLCGGFFFRVVVLVAGCRWFLFGCGVGCGCFVFVFFGGFFWFWVGVGFVFFFCGGFCLGLCGVVVVLGFLVGGGFSEVAGL
ncbi:hypothetical protein ACWKWZ_27930, partial [Metapseudomonas otitidis]